MASITQKTEVLSATAETVLFSFDKSFKQLFPFSIKNKQTRKPALSASPLYLRSEGKIGGSDKEGKDCEKSVSV